MFIIIRSNLKFLHQTLHSDAIQHSRIYQRLLYTIFHIELLLIINKNYIPKNMEPILLSTIDTIQLQLNGNVCFAVHLIILFLYIYSYIYQQLIGIQFTLHTYFYIFSNFILLAVFTQQSNYYDIAFKIINFVFCCLINSSYISMSLSDQYFETNPFLFRYKNFIYQILSIICVVTSIILSTFNIQLWSQICLTFFYIFHFINLEVFQINTTYQATTSVMGIVIISTLWIIGAQDNYQYTNKNDAFIIFMTVFTFSINIYKFLIKEYQTHIALNPKNYEIEILKYQQLFTENSNNNNIQFMNLLISQNLDCQHIIDERIKNIQGSQEYLQIVTFLLKTQPIRAFTFLEMHNAQFQSFYVNIAISTLKQLFKNQQQEQLLEPAYVYEKFQVIQKNIDDLFLLVQMKIKYLNQLQSNLIEKDVLYQSSFEFGKSINENQFIIENPDTFQELKFLEIYHFLILNNQSKMKKYAKQVLQQQSKDSLDLQIEKSKSLFLSFDNINFDIKSIQKDKLVQFTNYKENLNNIKQIMPKFIAERHDDLIRFFLSSGKSALIEKSFKTFYTDSEFIYPCSIQQFLTSTQNQLNILINKIDDTNSYIIFDICGTILEYTHDLDLEKNNNIFNYVDLRRNLEILKHSIKTQDIYILNNLQSTLYWNYCKLNSQQSTTQQLGSQDDNSPIQWPLLSQQFFNNQLEMNREIYYSLSFHTLGKSADKYQYFQITISNDISAQSSSHSSTINQLANLMQQLNQQTPKLLANQNKQTTQIIRTADHSPINNTQLWSPINSKLLANNQAVTYSDNKNKFNLQGSECSYASSRQDNVFFGLVENPQLNIINMFRAVIILSVLILFIYGILQILLAQSQINYQVGQLYQVAYVQQLNYRYLQRFYLVYSQKEQDLGLIELNDYSQTLFNQEVVKLELEIDKFKLSNQIFVLTNSEETYIDLHDESMNIFQFYNMFYLDILEGLKNNFATKFMLEFIVFNDDAIDGIVNQVDLEFETLLKPLNTIMILFNCFLFLLILFEVKIQTQICSINKNILLATLQIDQQAILDQIELCQIFVKYKDSWTRISYLDYIQLNDKQQQGIRQMYRSSNQNQQRQITNYAIAEEIEAEKINFKSLIHIILQIILIAIIMLFWYIYIDLQIQLLQGYFQFNYKSTQVQQHFLASINQGELIKTHGILYNYDNYELLDIFAHHFVALIPEQLSELVKYVLQMDLGQKTVDVINNDMCQFTKLYICDTPYHFLVAQGLLGFTSEFTKSLTSQYYIEINEQRYTENKDEQIQYLQSTDHIYYFLYFMLDISQVVQELIDYSYKYIKDYAQNIFEQFYILMFTLYTPILLIVFILLILQINKQKQYLICLFKILYLIGEDQQQQTKIKHLLRTLKRQIY